MITSPKPTGKELWKAFVDAIWALLMPVIILGGIYGGYFTPTEAAAVAVVYGLIIGLFVYRELKWKDIPKTFVNAARTSAAVMLSGPLQLPPTQPLFLAAPRLPRSLFGQRAFKRQSCSWLFATSAVWHLPTFCNYYSST